MHGSVPDRPMGLEIDGCMADQIRGLFVSNLMRVFVGFCSPLPHPPIFFRVTG